MSQNKPLHVLYDTLELDDWNYTTEEPPTLFSLHTEQRRVGFKALAHGAERSRFFLNIAKGYFALVYIVYNERNV